MGVRMRRRRLVNCFFRNSNRSMYIGLINLSFLSKVMVVGKGKDILRCRWCLSLYSLLLLLFSYLCTRRLHGEEKKEKRTKDPQLCTIRSVDILIAFVGEEKWLFSYHQQNDICRRFAHIVLAVSIIYSCVRLIDINQTFTPHWFDPASIHVRKIEELFVPTRRDQTNHWMCFVLDCRQDKSVRRRCSPYRLVNMIE